MYWSGKTVDEDLSVHRETVKSSFQEPTPFSPTTTVSISSSSVCVVTWSLYDYWLKSPVRDPERLTSIEFPVMVSSPVSVSSPAHPSDYPRYMLSQVREIHGTVSGFRSWPPSESLTWRRTSPVTKDWTLRDTLSVESTIDGSIRSRLVVVTVVKTIDIWRGVTTTLLEENTFLQVY